MFVGSKLRSNRHLGSVEDHEFHTHDCNDYRTVELCGYAADRRGLVNGICANHNRENGTADAWRT
jgi:hypothetical protein